MTRIVMTDIYRNIRPTFFILTNKIGQLSKLIKPKMNQPIPTPQEILAADKEADKLLEMSRRITDKGLGGRVITVEDRLDRGDKRMGSIESGLAANTLATTEVLEIVRMGKSFFKVLGHIGNIIKWGASIGAPVVALYAAYKHSQS